MRYKNNKTGNEIVAEQSFIDGLVDSVDWVIMQDRIPTLDENKQAKIKHLQDKYQAQYDAYLAQYPQSEIATFDDKKREALAYNSDNTVATPIIDAIVLNWGGTKVDYMTSVLAKITYLAGQEGAMVKVRDAIKACTTQAELDLIII